ncbi:hypothetical protein Forpe1208_v006717 [Fusarium oxysporum f. sp. rapae]|uniref:Uncharacterized protein n=1 Tax=Fusarium oxysporum f. sp. rapae TaxID=485398 RepID=A0A8J5TYX3_FUSOX|nr:hypothetical protein Forpe1208_v006717 [Fusarium oxysporum f. sp. rapae]
MKFDGWVSLRLDWRIRVDNAREPWTTDTAKETNLPAVPKSPSGLIEQLAHVIQSEIPRISFNYFLMHKAACYVLKDLKRALTAEIGPSFRKYIPSEDKLPFVVGYVFSTAAGHGSSDVRESAGWAVTGSSISQRTS